MLCFCIIRNSSTPGQMNRALFCRGGGGGMWGRGGNVGSGSPICNHGYLLCGYMILILAKYQKEELTKHKDKVKLTITGSH